jgi:hypothetical protein
MKIPPKGTNRHKVLVALYKHGPMKASDVTNLLPSLGHDAVSSAIAACTANKLLNRYAYTYELTDAARHYFDGCIGERDGYVPQIAAPRQVSMFTPPMKGYEAAMRSNRR